MELYEKMTTLNLIKYEEHKVCKDLIVMELLFSLQSRYIKYFCFFFNYWKRKATKDHYVEEEWPIRYVYIPIKVEVKHNPVIGSNNVLLPTLHM